MDLPIPVTRYLEAAHPDGPAEVDTAVFVGSGRFRRRPLPWMPFANTISLRVGLDRVSDMFVRLGPLTLMKVLDAYVDGHGITKFLSTADTGDRIDQGSVHPLLCEALMFPSSWPRVPGFAWEAVDDHTARMAFELAGGTEVATVGFDPATGLPATYETARFQGKDGPKVDWRVDMFDWGRSSTATIARRIVVTWANEPGPWLQERFTRVTTDVDIEEPLERARASIARANRV